MRLALKKVQAIFPGDQVRLEAAGEASMFWDEHGGTFVVRLEGLKICPWPGEECAPGVRLVLELTPHETVIRELQNFAGAMNLPPAPAPAAPEVTEQPFLVAAHVPDRSLFIFAEEAQLAARGAAPGEMEIEVTGAFRSRRVSCQEHDVVLHLTPAAVARLVAFLGHLAEGAG